MSIKRKLSAVLLLIVFASAVPGVYAVDSGGEYKAIVGHLKTKYRAKKVKVPFLWLARFAVSVVRPAGVKSFSITLFEGLQITGSTLDQEMRAAMKNSFGPDWSPILRVRSRDGQQVYMYMRESRKDVKITVVTMEKDQAAVIRATFSPEKLLEFMDNPKIFGVSLDDGDRKDDQSESLKQVHAAEAKPIDP